MLESNRSKTFKKAISFLDYLQIFEFSTEKGNQKLVHRQERTGRKKKEYLISPKLRLKSVSQKYGSLIRVSIKTMLLPEEY